MSDITSTLAAKRRYPDAAAIAGQFGHALKVISCGAECVHCGAIFAESDALYVGEPYVGDAEARDIAGDFARDCPRYAVEDTGREHGPGNLRGAILFAANMARSPRAVAAARLPHYPEA
jgi:hypothetical protein